MVESVLPKIKITVVEDPVPGKGECLCPICRELANKDTFMVIREATGQELFVGCFVCWEKELNRNPLAKVLWTIFAPVVKMSFAERGFGVKPK